jgi:hypothetical protein
MKNFILIFTLLLMTLGCSQQPSESEKADAEAAIKGFYSAMEKFDYDALKSYCTPEFTLFEDGKIYSNFDEFLAVLKTFEGGQLQINMNFVRTDVERNMAHSTINFEGSFKSAELQLKIKSFENYLLKKINGKWLIDFVHSSYLPDENNKEFTSIHLLQVPSKLSIASLNEAIQKINKAIGKIGYPDCGYSIMNIVPEKDIKYNHVMTGKWKNEEAYNTIHNDAEYKKAIEEVKNELIPFFENQVYVKYVMP